MSDLDDLASARNEAYQPDQRPRRRTVRRVPKQKVPTNWAIIAAVLGVVLAFGIGVFAGREWIKWEVRSAFRAAAKSIQDATK